MAIGRVSGPMLQANLLRQGSDLAFETNLLYIDVSNSRIGIGTATPGFSLEVAGDAEIGNIELDTNTITTTNTDGDLILNANGTGNISVSGKKITNIGTPTANTDAANKTYVDSQIGGSTGMSITLATPTDSSLTTDGAFENWTTSTYVTDAIDDLNEVTENIRNDKFVKSTSFVANVTSGGAGQEVTLTITTVGNPTHYDIDWGAFQVATNNTTDSTPSHTYNSNANSPYSIVVTAKNTGGAGSGSEASSTRTNYITIYTADPAVSFAAYAALTGGSPITYWDDGATVYFDNNTTNIGGATIQYTWDWDDSEADNVITNDSAAGGSAGARLAHTFTASTEQEVTRTVNLTLNSHSTADPSLFSASVVPYKIYDTHTPTIGLSGTTGINQEGTSGLPITFTNNTENTIGSFSGYGQQYVYTWGDGTANTTINVGVGGSGDTGNTLAHTFALTAGNQASGTDVDYVGNLRVTSDHSSSPFISANFTVHVEPDVRCNVAATAVTVSDLTGDGSLDIYDFTDYSGNNRALVRATNTSQNANSYVYTWNDGDTNNVTEDGSAAGSIGAPLDHSYLGESTGNYNASVLASGTPDLTAQTDTESAGVFTLKAAPAAPGNLSAEALTLSDAYQGSSPKLCASFTDNSTSNPLAAGADLTTTTARRYTTGTIDTNLVTDAYNGGAGTLTAKVNGVDRGNKTFSATLSENGTFTSLIVSDQGDAHNTISASTYPTGFYQTFDAKITQAIGSYTVGVNDERLEHSVTGNTNYVSVVYDDITASPTVANVGTLSEGTAGTKKYISGVPYYNTGSPTLNLAGVQISNLTGQAYTDVAYVVEVDSGTNQEGTSSGAFSDQNYTYANIDGASTMLSGGIPITDTGVASAYTLGTLSIPVTTSSVRTIDRARLRCRNANGATSYSNIGTTNIQVHTAQQSGIDERAIVVSDDLGNGTYTDDASRIFHFKNQFAVDNPTLWGSSTNYLGNSSLIFSEDEDPDTGVENTHEATIRLGVMKYDVTDYSTGYLPVGPDRSGDTGSQYYTFAFRRQVVSNFDINITSAGIAGLWIAAPGSDIHDSSGLNGWLDSSLTYAGSGIPGSDTGNGGNGSNGCAFTSGDRIAASTALSGGYTMTLGSECSTNATANVLLVRIKLNAGQTVTAISIGEAS